MIQLWEDDVNADWLRMTGSILTPESSENQGAFPAFPKATAYQKGGTRSAPDAPKWGHL